MVRTAREVLLELKWREGLDLGRAVVQIVDRNRSEGSRVLPGSEITSLGRRYFSTAAATIPFYKILRITYAGDVLFERRSPR